MKVGEIDIPLNTIAHVLCSACEGGVGYWARINWDKSVKPETVVSLEDFDELGEVEYVHWPLSAGGSIAIEDIEYPNDEPPAPLNLETIEKGLNLMAKQVPHQFANVVNLDHDAFTGDLLVQFACFGKHIYN